MKINISGACLNKGSSRIEIRSSNEFSLYMHTDSKQPLLIPLSITNMRVKNHLVSLGQQIQVDVVEHLFSALYGLNLFNVKIDVYGNELPFFDGSSLQYAEVLKPLVSPRHRKTFFVNKKITVSQGSSFLIYEPLVEKKLFIDMELFHPFIDRQRLDLEINEKNYLKEIAPARTFVFTNEKDPRLKDLPPYGIGITAEQIYSKEPLRFSDELVRHKILDLLGDLYVLKSRLKGRITCRNTSHILNLKLAHRLITEMTSH
jgi:UDP-3-O-[3-hydroxymyristoyl] N-acetylglucosamine deacetylase